MGRVHARQYLQVRTSNSAALGFYARMGYVQEERVNFGKRLVPDPGEREG